MRSWLNKYKAKPQATDKPLNPPGASRDEPDLCNYSYENLTGDHDFRLLELLPGERRSPIKCRLKLSRLDAQPLYNAVSYTWGEPPADKTIFVNNLNFGVRKNLYDLLVELRHSHHAQTYWIDAICINQGDPIEKSIQVRKMASIYQTAVGVISWLRDYEVLADAGHNKSILIPVSHALRLESSGSQKQSWYSADIPHAAAVTAFLDHEYWRRRWIIQEVALARSVEIRCGPLTVPLAHIKTLLRGRTSLGPNRSENSLAAQLCNLQGSLHASNSDLKHLLSDYALTKCKDPLDKVYALVSLSKQAREKFPVFYHTDLLDLLMRTLQFSTFNEGLDVSETIAFALMLAEQLDMPNRDLNPPLGRLFRTYEGSLYDWRPNDQTAANTIHSVLYKRGVVTSSVVDPTLFHQVQALREQCRTVDHYDMPMSLKQDYSVSGPKGYGLWRGSPANASHWSPYEPSRISPRDLFAFTWKEPGNSTYVGIGFASARTETGDVISQIPGARVGLVLRKVAGGAVYNIVGRARLAFVNARDTFLLSDKYEPRDEQTEYIVLYTQGWRTLDLIRLAHDNI